MPFTVSCTACNSRFLLGDDLFRRKVSGNIVTVKCRNCEAEISVDARDVASLPRRRAPRRAPAPPRPKAKMALLAPEPAGSATSTPVAEDSRSIWDSGQTLGTGGKSEAPESVDFEEIPSSRTSDAPPLGTLTHEPGLVHPPRPKKKADDFLFNLNAGTAENLGAPTIDISSFAAPRQPEGKASELDAAPTEATTQRTRTAPLFDMSAVLPAAPSAGMLGSANAEPLDIDFSTVHAEAPPSAGRTREPKYEVAPESDEASADTKAARKARRGGAFVWLAAAAVAAAVLLLVGARGRRTAPPVATEPSVTTALGASLAAPSADVTPAIAEAASAAPEAATAARAVNAAPSSAAKNIPSPKAEAMRLAKPEVAVAAEKPAETEALTPVAVATPAVEARQAIEPAAPGTEFDRSAAVNALKGAAAQASSCRKDGDPSGTATITVTFAESGRVTSATIQGPPFAGTATGGCIASMVRHASVPPFDGDRVTVTKTVVIE